MMQPIDKPPSYSNLPPPTFDEATAAEREKAKRANRARLAAAIIGTFLICLCLATFILAIIFGFWMSQCQKTGFVASVSFSSVFEGEGPRRASINIDEGISIRPSSTISSEIFTSLIISSPKQQKNPAQDNIILKANASDYKITRKDGFWRCSRFSAKVSILDASPETPSPPSSSPLSLEVITNRGDIQMEGFQLRGFEEVRMRAPNGIVTVGGARVQGLLSVRAAGEGIGVFHSLAETLEILGHQTGISMGNTTSSIYSVQTKQGSILSSTIFLSSSSSCEAQFFTSQGTIQLQHLSLDPLSSTPCKISIGAKRGDISLNLANFSGRYSIQASRGNARVNAKSCEGGFCSGTIRKEGPMHELLIMSKAGNIDLSFD